MGRDKKSQGCVFPYPCPSVQSVVRLPGIILTSRSSRRGLSLGLAVSTRRNKSATLAQPELSENIEGFHHPTITMSRRERLPNINLGTKVLLNG